MDLHHLAEAHARMKRRLGPQRIKTHISAGLVVTSLGPLLFPDLAVILALVGIAVNLIWVWET